MDQKITPQAPIGPAALIAAAGFFGYLALDFVLLPLVARAAAGAAGGSIIAGQAAWATGHVFAALVMATALAAVQARLGRGRHLVQTGLLIGAGAMTAAVLASFGIAAVLGTLAIGPAAGPPGPLALPLLLIGWLAHGFAEEAAFRGMIQPAIGARFGAAAGVAAGAILWVGLQALQGYASPLGLAISLILGVAFGLLALRCGLAAAVGAHAAWGFVELALLRSDVGFIDVRFTNAADTAVAPLFAGVALVGTIALFLLTRKPSRG